MFGIMVGASIGLSEHPLVSIVMPVFNDMAYLSVAIESVLGQTYPHWELLIIDDGSTDETPTLLQNWTDARIRVIRNPENWGVTRSLQRGLALAQGSYIARMDSDDVALPTRLAKQVQFLERHPEVGILGSRAELMDVAGRSLGLSSTYTTDWPIRWASLLTNPFVHPTVMLRRATLTKLDLNYDETYRTSQDYDLWTRMLMVTEGANLAEPLLQYRVRDGVTQRRRQEQLENHDRIALRTICRMLPDFAITLEQVTQLRSLLYSSDRAAIRADVQRAMAAQRYLDLLQAFADRYPNTVECRTVQLELTWQILRILLPLPWAPGSRDVIQQLPIGEWESLLWFGEKLRQRLSQRFLRLFGGSRHV